MNQSPEATAWPLMSVCVRLGLGPRIEARSFSEKPPSPPADDAMLTPGTRWMASATFLSGSLPMSSAVTTSTTESGLRLRLGDASTEAGRPRGRGGGRGLREDLHRRERTEQGQGRGGGDRVSLEVHALFSLKSNE